MTIGYFIGKGDKTTCGGEVLDGDDRVIMYGLLHAREWDRVSCGKDGKIYQIIGGISFIDSHGKLVAGTLDSVSGCPCGAELIPSVFTASYRNEEENPAQQTGRAWAPSAAPVFAKSFDRSFAIINSHTGQPLTNRTYIALVDGRRKVGRTDANGIAIVEAPTAASVIELHVMFQAPARELAEFSEAIV
ncbi:MAG: hypothetical protein JWP80_816 [Pseudomonas sp.]|nr:hypothetical protein [Pseudomonas sp.]